ASAYFRSFRDSVQLRFRRSGPADPVYHRADVGLPRAPGREGRGSILEIMSRKAAKLAKEELHFCVIAHLILSMPPWRGLQPAASRLISMLGAVTSSRKSVAMSLDAADRSVCATVAGANDFFGSSDFFAHRELQL